MRKTRLFIALLVVVTATLSGYAAFHYLHPGPEWTTTSEEALSEFEQGLAAEQRFYEQEAMEHFDRALELDPGFVMARLKRIIKRLGSDEDWERAREVLEGIDTQRLTSREEFFVRYLLARYKEDCEDEPEALLRAYLEKHPDDPYVLDVHCDWLWREGGDVDKAEQCYKELLAVDPNWVTAQNRLGYIAMSQGRFSAAEGYFLTYLFVAPDQANPHDSLAELLLLLGRYQEAHRELEAALAVRESFCPSYEHLVTLAFLSAEPDLAEDAAVRAGRHCGEERERRLRCRQEFQEQMLDNQWQALAERWDDACVQIDPSLRWIIHRGAVLDGQPKLARAVEKTIQRQVDSREHFGMDTTGLLLHLTAVRLVAMGDPVSASELFRDADQRLAYRGIGEGSLKLFNRLNWSHAAALTGDQETADRLVGEVAAVNPQLGALFREGRLAMPMPELGSDTRE